MKFRLGLVTGATSGIGMGVCERLAREGIPFLATGRDLVQLQALQQKLQSQVNVQILAVDLAEPTGRASLIRWIHHEAPDLVINNAGFGLYGEALSYTTEEQSKILTVNGQATLEITLEAARTLITKHQPGVVLNISSAAGFQSLAYSAVYAASKAFINSFSQALDFELKPSGVRVLTLCPGMVDTDFQRRAGGKRQEKEKGVMTVEFVVEEMWQQIQRGQSLRIINWIYRWITYFSYFIPNSMIAVFSKKVLSARILPRNFITIDTTHDN